VIRAIAGGVWWTAAHNIAPWAFGIAPPGPRHTRTLPPRPRDLVDAYAEFTGAPTGAYPDTVPPHLFPQWIFPSIVEALSPTVYPLMSMVNGGCTLTVNGPVPVHEPLELTTQLTEVLDDGTRAIAHLDFETGPKTQPDALSIHMVTIYKRPQKREPGQPRPERRKRTVPEDAQCFERRTFAPADALDFARLTGDFNPIHWITPYARLYGFPNTILHGFAGMGLAYEAISRGLLEPGRAIETLSVKFVRPIVLPRDVGFFTREGDGGEREFYVGDAPGEQVYVTGTFVDTDSATTQA